MTKNKLANLITAKILETKGMIDNEIHEYETDIHDYEDEITPCQLGFNGYGLNSKECCACYYGDNRCVECVRQWLISLEKGDRECSQ